MPGMSDTPKQDDRALPDPPPARGPTGQPTGGKRAPAGPAPAHDALAEAARDELLRALTLGSLGAPAL